MLAKITRGNQITIPKEVLKEARLQEGATYMDVVYSNGVIYLKPVVVEERISPEQYDKFENWALNKDSGDITVDSIQEGLKRLKTKQKRIKKDN